ncbi:MAG: pitrilysin family protein [Vicinamibacterales bacterium]
MSPVDRTRFPLPGPDPAFTFPVADRQRLPNGLALSTVERPGLPMVSLALLLPAGSAADPGRAPGLASMTADMLDEGSGERSAIEMQEALARIGAELDTETGPDSVVLSLSLLDRFVPQGLRILADLVVRPRLGAADFERVRTLRINRIRQLRDVPGVNAEAVFSAALYGPHPYGHLSIGSSASLSGMSADDVTRFHRLQYDPSRATLVAVGAIDGAALARHAEEAFGAWPRDGSGQAPPEETSPEASLDPGAPVPATRLLIVDRPGAAQTELRVGHLGVPRKTPDYHALVLLNAVLGGHFSSRLNLNLRERKGYTYGVRSAFEFRKMAGPFSVQTSVQTDATADAVAEILRELDDLAGRSPASEDERTLSVATLTKGYPRNFETSGQIARGLAQLALYDLPDDTFGVFAPRIRSVAIEDIARAAHQYLRPQRAMVVAVGDCSRIRGGLEAAGLGEAEVVAPDL